MRIHFYNTYVEGGAAKGTMDNFNALALAHPDHEWAYYYKTDFGKGVAVAQELKRHYHVVAPDTAKVSSPFKRLKNTIDARLFFKRYLPYWHGKPDGFETFSNALQWYKTPLKLFGGLPEIIHLNYLGEWLDLPSFLADVPKEHPIVWTLHDMMPLTGGCHYSADCQKYQSTCNQCPQLSSYRDGDLATKVQQIKRELFAGRNLHIVADSHWLAAEAQKSSILKDARSFQAIHYALDAEAFKPSDKRAARNRLGIGSADRVVAFGASSVTNQRKGVAYLIDALKRLATQYDQLTCLTFGASGLPQDALPTNVRTVSAGHISDPVKLAGVYAAADVFVVPSLQEAFGLTALEALACEVPVVGFNTGGIPDTVRPDVTGRLARLADAHDLADHIAYILNNPDHARQMGQNGRHMVLNEFSATRQLNAYEALYHKLNPAFSL